MARSARSRGAEIRMQACAKLKRGYGNVERTRGREHPFIEACQAQRLPAAVEELEGREVKRVERSDRRRKRLERPREDRRRQFEECDATEKRPDRLGVGA